MLMSEFVLIGAIQSATAKDSAQSVKCLLFCAELYQSVETAVVHTREFLLSSFWREWYEGRGSQQGGGRNGHLPTWK